ncbi:MAG: hypothetical protein AAGA30_04090 [Planctomycetota bacterium]
MTNEKPIKKFKSGNVEGAIWRNQKNGKTRHTIDFTKTYKTKEGFKRTKVFLGADLKDISKIALHTNSWIIEELANEALEKQHHSNFEMLDADGDFDVI